MALEDLTGTKYIDALDSANPVGLTDKGKQGDDHIRGIKNVLKLSFPGITGAVTATQTELNILDGATVTASELNVLSGVTAFLDDDTMTANSDTAIASQQSIKAYVDGLVSTLTGLINAVQTNVTDNTNGPAFRATHSTTQGVNNVSAVFDFDTEDFDTDGRYNTSTSQFTPDRSGKYMVGASIQIQGSGSSSPRLRVELRKNGTVFAHSSARSTETSVASEVTVSGLIDLDGSTDYVEVWTNFSDADNNGTATTDSFFWGTWIRT